MMVYASIWLLTPICVLAFALGLFLGRIGK